jgi:hypothetical protein
MLWLVRVIFIIQQDLLCKPIHIRFYTFIQAYQAWFDVDNKIIKIRLSLMPLNILELEVEKVTQLSTNDKTHDSKMV